MTAAASLVISGAAWANDVLASRDNALGDSPLIEHLDRARVHASPATRTRGSPVPHPVARSGSTHEAALDISTARVDKRLCIYSKRVRSKAMIIPASHGS